VQKVRVLQNVDKAGWLIPRVPTGKFLQR